VPNPEPVRKLTQKISRHCLLPTADRITIVLEISWTTVSSFLMHFTFCCCINYRDFSELHSTGSWYSSHLVHDLIGLLHQGTLVRRPAVGRKASRLVEGRARGCMRLSKSIFSKKPLAIFLTSHTRSTVAHVLDNRLADDEKIVRAALGGKCWSPIVEALVQQSCFEHRVHWPTSFYNLVVPVMR
jgi:hypothetical protein